MAIAPIQIPQTQANPLQAIMQGNATITQFFDRAIQMGRDTVNNQYRQDQALVQNMQLAQGLSQRRAQDLDQRLIDRRNFDYREQQDDRQFGLLQDRQQLAQDQALFNQGTEMQRLGLAERQLASTDAARQATLDAQIANQNADNAYQAGQLDVMRSREARDQAIFEQTGGVKPPTRSDIRADERLQISKDKAAASDTKSRMEQMVIGDTTAFAPQMQQYTRRFDEFRKQKGNETKTFDDYLGTLPATEVAAAQAYDKNAFESELQSARNTTEDAYATNIPNPTPAAVQKRREFWRYATGSSASSQQTQPGQPQGFSFRKIIESLNQ